MYYNYNDFYFYASDEASEYLETLENWSIILYDSGVENKAFADEIDFIGCALENMDYYSPDEIQAALDNAQDFILNNADYIAELEAALVS